MDITYENWRETAILYREPREYIQKITGEKADVLITEGDEIDEEILSTCPIKIIGVCRGNPVNVDIEEATKKNIPVLYAPKRNTEAVTELTIALMLSQARQLSRIDRVLKSGSFLIDTAENLAALYTRFKGFELGGKTIGIIGLGSIGYNVAKKLSCGFNAQILVYDPYVDTRKIKDVGATTTDLSTLLQKSDIVTVHAKVTEETLEIIGKKEIDMMKPTAILINTARAALVDEDALFNALKNKQIAGAGLDVFGVEPVDSDNRFLELDNVTVTPHIGGTTEDTEYRHSLIIAKDIERVCTNKKPRFIVNPEALKQ
jgi:phosphoglycerate dehydrogenase-like enzyme